MFNNYIKNTRCFKKNFLGTKSNPNSIKNPLPGLLALHSSTDIFFSLIHHIIKIENKSCSMWPKFGYLFTFHFDITYIKAFLLNFHRTDNQL